MSAVELLANWLLNFVVTLTAPAFLRSSPSGPYFLYGACTILTVLVCFGLPETKGKTLEEVELDFERRSIWEVMTSKRMPVERTIAIGAKT